MAQEQELAMMSDTSSTLKDVNFAPLPQTKATNLGRGFRGVRRAGVMSPDEFRTKHLAPELPVLMPGLCANWDACKLWSPDYFRAIAPTLQVPVKTYGEDGGVKVSRWPLKDYADFLERSETGGAAEGRRSDLPYCHDIPMFAMVKGLARDCRPFPAEFLPSWYRKDWWKYAQFFLGPSGSVTPLHFDTLITHNLFFQIKGRKRFTIIPPDQMELCGRRGWRWFDVDPEAPDFARVPAYRRASPVEIVVAPGDVLYMPPGTLHHVRGLDVSVSFNIDFHTKTSVLRALLSCRSGMPKQNVYYNTILALGLVLGVPPAMLFRYYRSYLSYVS
jgi:Cupin-like domain